MYCYQVGFVREEDRLYHSSLHETSLHRSNTGRCLLIQQAFGCIEQLHSAVNLESGIYLFGVYGCCDHSRAC